MTTTKLLLISKPYVLLGIFMGTAQKSTLKNVDQKPALVIGIVLDQMRYNYLTHFYSNFDKGGFKRLVENGFLCKNHHFNFVHTKTGPVNGSAFTYDTHVSLIFYGKNIKKGSTFEKTEANDIAPTLLALLNITGTPYSEDNIIEEVLAL